jgi:SAM-dependent methyltransferase
VTATPDRSSNWMKAAATADPLESTPIDVTRPTSARAYGWMLGGKDNYPADRAIVMATLQAFPHCVDIARQNRQFLYRVVRHLAAEAGIRQFLDLGCGLPTGRNVHQVAREFALDAKVAYVDIDPIVLAHARALLAEDASTTVSTADMRDPEAVIAMPEVARLIDFSEPVAVLYLSVGHHLTEHGPHATDARHALRHIIDSVAAPGSYLAVSQVVADDPEVGAGLSARIGAAGIPWQTRTPAELDAFLDGLEPVEPGLVNLVDWRPDPGQPPLDPAPPELSDYLGYTDDHPEVYEYGGLLRK